MNRETGKETGPLRWQHGAAAGLLAGFVLLLYSQLLFTDRVLAGGDIQLYFYPYWSYTGAQLRAGELPFWNPYLFLGGPLLANPQAAVLYPLHWPLFAAGGWGLPVTDQIYWSAALHTWLLGLGGYGLLRFWSYGWLPALLAGLLLAGSGFVGGLVAHINQLNATAWLPWALWVLAWAKARLPARLGWRAAEWSVLLRASALYALAVALMVLAGHTQTLFVNLCGLALWLIWPGSCRAAGKKRRCWIEPLPALAVYSIGLGLALLIAAPQLLPSLELSALGLRSGGLSYGEATSFSLQPLALGWTLLPSYGLADLGAVFDTPGYSEYVAYLGLTGLGAALLGAWRGKGAARQAGLLLATLGFLLALGRWNPLYFLLYQLVPGFDLFRAPARWMMLYTLGMALLGGTGLAALPMRRLPLLAGLIGLAAVELWFAARSLPYSHPTAPQAVFEVRSAPAHLLTSPDREFPGAAARFLGMSKITYDPGDLADYRQQLVEASPDPLDARAFQELVIAQKVQELLVPNLPLFWQIPAVDGFDGGLLPLQRYLRLAELLVPPDRLVPDGRLREQIDQVPPSSLLAMLNVAYVVTDKVGDLWFEDVFYDRRIGAALAPPDAPLEVEVPSVFEATHIDLIGAVTGDSAAWAEVAQTVAWLEVTDRSGAVERLPLTAGGGPGAHFADAALDSPLATRSGVTVAYRDLEGGRQEYRARLPLASAREVASLRIRAVDAPVTLTVQAVTLYDARTRMFAALLPSDRGRFQLEHSGDVKIYRNLDLLPRAFLARQPVAVTDLETAIEAVRSSAGTLTPVEGTLDGAQPAGPTDQAELLAYQPERVQIRTQSAAPALLVLSDSFYPGWSATVDGFPAQIKATNVQFRGVVVPAGEHTVIFTFLPTGWQLGVVLAALGGGLLLALASLGCMLARKVRYNHSHGRVTTQAR